MDDHTIILVSKYLSYMGAVEKLKSPGNIEKISFSEFGGIHYYCMLSCIAKLFRLISRKFR